MRMFSVTYAQCLLESQVDCANIDKWLPCALFVMRWTLLICVRRISLSDYNIVEKYESIIGHFIVLIMIFIAILNLSSVILIIFVLLPSNYFRFPNTLL